MSPCGPEPFLPLAKPILTATVISVMTEAWNKRWKSRKDSRQTGIFFPAPNVKKGEDITRLSKHAIGIAVRAVTGHDFRPRHVHVLNKQVPPSCSFCLTEEESPSHLILKCPRFNHLRAFIFGSYTADIIRTWTVSQIVTFFSEPSISEEDT